jgi:hypothetical protein
VNANFYVIHVSATVKKRHCIIEANTSYTLALFTMPQVQTQILSVLTKIFLWFFSITSGKIQGTTGNQTTVAQFHILSTSLFIKHGAIWHCIG